MILLKILNTGKKSLDTMILFLVENWGIERQFVALYTIWLMTVLKITCLLSQDYLGILWIKYWDPCSFSIPCLIQHAHQTVPNCRLINDLVSEDFVENDHSASNYARLADI